MQWGILPTTMTSSMAREASDKRMKWTLQRLLNVLVAALIAGGVEKKRGCRLSFFVLWFPVDVAKVK